MTGHTVSIRLLLAAGALIVASGAAWLARPIAADSPTGSALGGVNPPTKTASSTSVPGQVPLLEPVTVFTHVTVIPMDRELSAFVRDGLTPYEALETGTRNVASYFGTLDSSGTVAVGKRADLVLLPGNPLEDIGHTARPAGVMLAGHWLSRAMLDKRLAELEGKVR